MSLFIDFHVLQTLPPSCVNRDDTGSPKTAVYGGTVRARVSSQAWKHAMRIKFKDLFMKEELGSRTKNVVEMIEKEILSNNDNISKEEAHKRAKKVLESAGIKIKAAKKDETEKAEALFFMSNKQAKILAEIASKDNFKENEKETKEMAKNALKENVSVDIALFGRMVASDPTLNCDATAQVAHAISTHAVQNEYDYFTAIDDLQNDDNAGAGHLGTIEFNSATLYRYATVNAVELANIIGIDNVASVIKKFGYAFIYSMPNGKENTFANRTFPEEVYVTIRQDQPVNLSGAYEKAIRNSELGYSEPSQSVLKEYAKCLYEKYDSKPYDSYCIGEELKTIARKISLPNLLLELEDRINELIKGEI
jgi:CRISPR system Cascade subunit CasC